MFNETERLILLNQYRILSALQPSEGWEQLRDILQFGFEGQYSLVSESLYDPLSKEDCRFVEDTMAVYDALQRPFVEKNEEVPIDLRFLGFDGNNEGAHMSYARFLVSGEHRWTYIATMVKDDFNSHMPLINKYQRMVEAWKAIGSPHSLGGDDAQKILKA